MPTSCARLVLLRAAVNEDWPVCAEVRPTIVGGLMQEVGAGHENTWRILPAARVLVAMDRADRYSERLMDQAPREVYATLFARGRVRLLDTDHVSHCE